MPETTAIAPLRVANEAFLVASMIERCPKTMMLRELVVNGLEAAGHAVSGGKQVVIASRIVKGVPKLCIWNTGLGLTGVELLQITDLASSLRKINSLDQNFGMGAKVASLPSNKHGLRYRSCRGGQVSEVVLGYRDGIYGRLRVGTDGVEVVDATAVCLQEANHDLNYDWTEVVLCGNAAGQDTVVDPYGGTAHVDAFWIPRYLENRFFRLPQDVALSLTSEVTGGTGPANFIGLGDRRDDFGQSETRETPSGVKIHYYFDPPEEGSTQPASGAARSSIVFRGEMYDVREGEQWLADAPIYGIPFGAKYCSAFVELPDDYLVWPEAYRQFLRLRGGHQRQVFMSDFSSLVRAYLPPWLAKIIQSFGPRPAHYLGEISEELKALLAELGVSPEQRGLAIPGARPPPPKVVPPVEMVDRDISSLPDSSKLKPTEPLPKPKAKGFEQAPEIIAIRSSDMIAERALEGRAARFYPQSHQIFVNLTYSAIGTMAAQLELEHGEAEELEIIRRVAIEVSEWCMIKKVTRAVVYSLAKKSAGWRPEEVTRSQSPECLSLVADDWSGLIAMARLRFAEVLAEQTGVHITVAA